VLLASFLGLLIICTGLEALQAHMGVGYLAVLRSVLSSTLLDPGSTGLARLALAALDRAVLS